MNPEQWLSLKWNGGSTMSDRWLNQSKIIHGHDFSSIYAKISTFLLFLTLFSTLLLLNNTYYTQFFIFRLL